MKVIIKERKLTKAEKNKKEEIIKSMKKDGKDPNYAVATAQAKKVAQESNTGYDFLYGDDETGTMTSEPIEPEAVDLGAANLEMTRRQLWGQRKATIMRAAKEAWLEWSQDNRDYDWAGSNDKVALNVLVNDPNAENRVKLAGGEFEEFKKPIIRLISDANAGLESLSEQEKKLFLRYLMITGLEFGLHTQHTSNVGRFGDIVIALLKKYLKNPEKNPKSLSDRWKNYSDQYDINFTMDPIVFNLRESKKKIKVMIKKT